MPKEYVPVDAYGLLRRIVDRGPQRVRQLQALQDATAAYLVSRGLAEPTSGGERLENTEAGRRVGLIDWEPTAA